MAWVLVAVFFSLMVLLGALYRRTFTHLGELCSLLVLVLLDDGEHVARRADLVDLVLSAQVKRAVELSTEVSVALVSLANKLAPASVLGAQAALWQLRKDHAHSLNCPDTAAREGLPTSPCARP